jgi:hypothetical protein
MVNDSDYDGHINGDNCHICRESSSLSGSGQEWLLVTLLYGIVLWKCISVFLGLVFTAYSSGYTSLWL